MINVFTSTMELFFFHLDIFCQRKLEKKKNCILHTLIQKKMSEFLLTSESCAVHLCERLRVLRYIYAQPLSMYKLDSQVLMMFRSLKSIAELILNRSWK